MEEGTHPDTGATGEPAASGLDLREAARSTDVTFAIELVELAAGELDRALAHLDECTTERDALAAVLDAVLAAAAVGHAIVTADGRVEEWSDRAATIVGLAPRAGARLARLDGEVGEILAGAVQRAATERTPTDWMPCGAFAFSCAAIGEPVTERVLVLVRQAGSDAGY